MTERMHKAKLNLSVNAVLKDQMKQYAAQHGKTISQITDDLYEDLLSQETRGVTTILINHFTVLQDFINSEVKFFKNMSLAQSWLKATYSSPNWSKSLIRDQKDNWLSGHLRNKAKGCLDTFEVKKQYIANTIEN